MEGTETLCPLATTSNHRWWPGTSSRLLSVKPEEWMHLSPIYTRMHNYWIRYAKSTSQYSLAFSLKVRDDWGSQVNPHNAVTRHKFSIPAIRERGLHTQPRRSSYFQLKAVGSAAAVTVIVHCNSRNITLL